MQNSKKINGILVLSPINSSVLDGGFSPDYSCPNQKYGKLINSVLKEREENWRNLFGLRTIKLTTLFRLV